MLLHVVGKVSERPMAYAAINKPVSSSLLICFSSKVVCGCSRNSVEEGVVSGRNRAPEIGLLWCPWSRCRNKLIGLL